MLTLSNIHKEYASGELRVEALKGVSLSFRKNWGLPAAVKRRCSISSAVWIAIRRAI